MDPIVITVFGYSLTIGVVVSALTQYIKTSKKIPYLHLIPGVKALTKAIASGNKQEIRFGIALVAVVANAVSVYMLTGAMPSVQTLLLAFQSFISALGTYDLMFRE